MSETNVNKKRVISSDDDKLETDTSILASKKPEKVSEDIVDSNESSQVEGSTQWRLRIKNVPKFASAKMIKELLAKHSCGDVRVKKSHEWDFCYAFFKAIDKLKNVNFKNRTLVVNVDNITEQHRQSLFDQRHEKRKKIFFDPTGEIQRSPEELLADQVTPLHKLPYEEQLKNKEDVIKKSLSKFRNKIKDLYKERSLYQPKWAMQKSDSNLPCTLQPIIASPILEGYRNKCEFTIGRNLNGEITEPDKSLNVSEVAKKIVKAMKDYIVTSPYEVYDNKSRKGTWRMISVRSQVSDDVMIIIQIHPQGLTEEKINQEKAALAEYFVTFSRESQFNLTSLLLQIYDGFNNGIPDDKPFDCIFGTNFIFEKMMDCRAFFQTNTLAAQVLYEKCGEFIKDLFPVEESAILIDMCCGTGTIGIALSKSLGNKIDKVIGIELCEEAVEDAKFNAKLNGKPIAILDPPRAGVHKNVIKALRECKAIDYFLYVSCDCNLATQNFIDLCRPTTNNFPGIPFKPVRAVGVDLFPHAKQVELLIEFHRDRDYPIKDAKSTNINNM
ncbi:2902_t:CDS:10 [Cetraspora pellucida]|uniref:2902_t:CDS:1 n=1 Tax=Cetraspora pellucida TaxID=1433469 RepID=A0ACA9LBD8_9GLOM|nr:2902_t:CDS:10 [Cetraspora pellucida]